MARLAPLLLGIAWAEYFPSVDPNTTWQAPLLQPWDPLRATAHSVMVAWTPAWNPWCALGHYELQSRRPGGHPLRFADLERLQHREAEVDDENWPGDAEWTSWNLTYSGLGRAFLQPIEPLGPHAVQYRVRACGRTQPRDGCSAWSPVQTAHTVLSAAQDKVNIYLRGTGRNAPDYNEIVVDQRTVYRRRDETGLVLAIFSRLDLSLQWLRTYDTQRDRDASLQMGRDIRGFNQSHFVLVVSSIAWEWHAARSLAQTLEFCGAYHFGQWSHIFAEQDHYPSNTSDLQQTASQVEFGHPLAFIGIPGIGTGMGWESLMYNTGHYEPRNLQPQHAIIRAIAYYDYVARIYRLEDVSASKADFYLKNAPPQPETIHNPYPKSRQPSASHNIFVMKPVYVPYIGNIWNHIIELIEANETREPYNYAFVLYTSAGVVKVDPRPTAKWCTEIERIWEVKSARYWPNNGSMLLPGVEFDERNCTDFIYHGYTEASPELCGDNFEACCTELDSPGFIAVECGVGVAPTVCRNATVEQMEPYAEITSLTSRWPYPFRIINWTH